jgi:D-alanyl-D-alanine carboxypeptidase
MRAKLFVFIILCLIFGAGFAVWKSGKAAAPSHTVTQNTAKPLGKELPAFDKTRLSRTDPASLWIVVNKRHQLSPKDYVPADLVFPAVTLRVPGHESMQLRQEAAAALEGMFRAASAEGIQLMLSSGYRSYSYQVNLYNGYVASQGQATADTQSARPGFSEHQTGLTADVEPTSRTCELQQCFADTPEGTWVAAHAYTYGFIIRYTPGDEDITGYEPEPWHLRYVGTDLAGELHRTNTATLEQFFGITGGKIYD